MFCYKKTKKLKPEYEKGQAINELCDDGLEISD